MKSSIVANRFAAVGHDGRLVALVADGLPEWPADQAALEALTDPQVGEFAAAYRAEWDRLAALPDADLVALTTLTEHIEALGVEAHRRITLSVQEPEGDDPPAGDPPAGDPPAGDPPPAADPPASDPPADPEREAQLAAMRARMEPPAPEPEPIEVGVSREDLLAAVTLAADRSAANVATAMATALAPIIQVRSEPAPEPPPGRRLTAAELSGFRPDTLAPTAGSTSRPRIDAKLLTSADIPNLPMGQEITGLDQLRDAMINRHRALGRSTGTEDEQVPVASLSVDVRPEIDLRQTDWSEARSKVRKIVGPDAVGIDPFTGKEALVASGGLAAPVEPYYPQLVIAQGARPVRDALPTFVADRGGIKLVLPPSLGTLQAATIPGQFADGVTNTDTSLVSASAVFVAGDVGSVVIGTGIPTGTTIVSRTNATTVVLSNATTATATSVTFRIVNRNPNNLGAPVGLQSVAQDAAGGLANVKMTYDVPLGTQAEFDVYAVYTSLQFANLTARTFPEQVEANIRLADALAARVADTQMLDVMTAWSTLFTGAKTFGTARQLLAQWGHMAAWYRNVERMDPRAVLRLGIPAWTINAMRNDYLSTFLGGGASNWGLSDDEIVAWLEQHRLVPFLYQDGPSDISQLFSTAGLSGATNTGTNSATPIAIPEFPGTGLTTAFRTKVVSFMFAEGTWLALTTGELNIGLVRDSILNSQNRFRNFQEEWETPAFVGVRSLRGVHTVAADGTYGAAASITLGAGSGL